MICGLLLLLRLVKRLAVDHQPKVESVTQSRLGGFPTAPCRPRPVRRVKVDVQSKSIGGGGGGWAVSVQPCSGSRVPCKQSRACEIIGVTCTVRFSKVAP